jgi:hypothetical protein
MIFRPADEAQVSGTIHNYAYARFVFNRRKEHDLTSLRAMLSFCSALSFFAHFSRSHVFLRYRRG